MKRILSPVVAVVATSAWAFAQPHSPSPEQQVRRISEKFLQSAKQPDSTLLQYLADDALFVDKFGVYTKADIKKQISHFPNGAKNEAKMVRNTRVTTVKVQGDNAVATARLWKSDGKQVNTTFVYNLTFAKRAGEWQIVSGSFHKD